MPLTDLVYWVTVTFKMIMPAHSTALMEAFLEKHHITQVCQHPYSPDLVPCDFWFFSKLKLPLKVRRFVNVAVTQYTSSINGNSMLPTPVGE
jgi:hypothetical protein